VVEELALPATALAVVVVIVIVIEPTLALLPSANPPLSSAVLAPDALVLSPAV